MSKENTILDLIEDSGVFSVEKMDNGEFLIEENCNNYYDIVLSKDQLIALANELLELAKT